MLEATFDRFNSVRRVTARKLRVVWPTKITISLTRVFLMIDPEATPPGEDFPVDDTLHPPAPRPAPVASVLRRVISIIGVHPSRTDLIAICTALDWGPLNRSEKRVKASLVQHLESMRSTILPFLETAEGAERLRKAYIHILKQQQQTG
jgi:hypothetical protein